MAKTSNSQKKTTKSTSKGTKRYSTANTKKVAPAKKAPATKSVTKATEDSVNKVEEVKIEKVTEKNDAKFEKKVTKNVRKDNNSSIISRTKNTISDNWERRKEFVISIIIIIVLAILVLLLAFCKRIPKLKNGEEVLASVKGLNITTDKFYTSLKKSYGTNDVINQIDEYIANDYVKKFTEDDQKYIDQVVNYYKQYADYYGVSFEDFLSQYVGISGVSSEKEFRAYVKKDYKKTLALKKYIGSTISEKELKKEYESSYKEKLTVRHILIEINDDVKEEDAKKQAEDLIKQLDEVKDNADELEKKFKELAYDNSNDSGTYEDGGLFKDFSKNGVDEAFYNAAKKLKKGEYTSEPVKSQYGYHVILKVSSKTNKYKDVKEKIKTDLAEKKLNEDSTLQTTAWDELRKKYKLKINDSDVKKNYEKTLSNATKKTDSKDEKTDSKKTDSKKTDSKKTDSQENSSNSENKDEE